MDTTDWHKIADERSNEIIRISDLLLSLLAVIHRDGGHYTDTHGVEKSSADAQQIVLAERQKLIEIKEILNV